MTEGLLLIGIIVLLAVVLTLALKFVFKIAAVIIVIALVVFAGIYLFAGKHGLSKAIEATGAAVSEIKERWAVRDMAETAKEKAEGIIESKAKEIINKTED